MKPRSATDPIFSVSRRALLLAGVGAAGAYLLTRRGSAASTSAPKRGPTVRIESFDPAGKSLGVSEVPRVAKSD